MCTSMNKFSVFLLYIILAVITYTQAYNLRPKGCKNFGHSCYGGHGKRSSQPFISAEIRKRSWAIDNNNNNNYLRPGPVDSLPELSSSSLDDGGPVTSNSGYNRKDREIPLHLRSASTQIIGGGGGGGGFIQDKYMKSEELGDKEAEDETVNANGNDNTADEFSLADAYDADIVGPDNVVRLSPSQNRNGRNDQQDFGDYKRRSGSGSDYYDTNSMNGLTSSSEYGKELVTSHRTNPNTRPRSSLLLYKIVKIR